MTRACDHSAGTIYRRPLKDARPYRRHLARLLLLTLLGTPLTLLSPIPLKVVVDSILGPRDLPELVRLVLPPGTVKTGLLPLAVVAAAFVVIALMKHLLEVTHSLLRTYTGERLV